MARVARCGPLVRGMEAGTAGLEWTPPHGPQAQGDAHAGGSMRRPTDRGAGPAGPFRPMSAPRAMLRGMLERLPLLALLLLAAGCATTQPVATPVAASAPAAPLPEVLRLQRPVGGEWLGLYLLDRKAGWLYADTAADVFEGLPAIRAELALALELAVGGNVARRYVVDRRWYERRDGGRLLGFEAIRRGDGGDRHLTARCDGTACAVRIRRDGEEEVRTIPLPPETATDADPVRLAAARRSAVEVTWLDLDELRLHRGRHAFDAVEGGRVRVLTREAGESFDLVTLLDESGATAEVHLGPGLVARAEPEAVARTLGTPAEVFELTAIRLPAPLPEAPERVVLEVEGLPEPLWRRDGRQQFEPLPDGAVVVTIDAGGALQAGPAEREPFLQATPSVDWDHPAVRALAAELRAGAGSPAELARLLLEEVHQRLEKAYGVSSDTASRVLAEGRGDCTEHALLFVALARAAGIPARQVHGLVHTDTGAGPALYWHEWAEILLDGRWVAVDPTFGQFPADATHLALGTGRSTSSTHVMGQLRIRRAAAPAPSPRGR